MKGNFNWGTCYFMGGGLGMLLLFIRISVFESGMFNAIKKTGVSRGNFFMLFTNGERFKKYICGILIGLPTWFVIGVLVTFSSEFAKKFGIIEAVDPGKAIMYAYAAISIGDILIGFVSQWLKSRKKALYIFYAITAFFMILFFTTQWNGSAAKMYWICAGLGFGTGFWAIFVTMAAEQFGTNFLSTVAVSVPNLVRGFLPLMLLLFQFLRSNVAFNNYVTGAWVTGIIILAIGIYSVIKTKETFGRDLDFNES